MELLEIKKGRLKRYYEAEEKILNSQSYTLGSRQLTRADLTKVQSMIARLESEIAALEKRGTTKRPVRRAIPID